MEKGFSWPRSPCSWSTVGEVLAPGAPSWEVESHYPYSWICGLPLPLLGIPQAAADPGLLSQSVLHWSVCPCGLWADVAMSAWLSLGLQDCGCVISWCLLLGSYSNFPTIKSAVEFERSPLCCVSVLS